MSSVVKQNPEIIELFPLRALIGKPTPAQRSPTLASLQTRAEGWRRQHGLVKNHKSEQISP
jgi:hypothetical protein